MDSAQKQSAGERTTVSSTAAGRAPGSPGTASTLSIVIPAYNEADNLTSSHLADLDARLAQEPFDIHVLVVDDGSEDDTGTIVEEFAKDHPRFTLIRNPHRGKAYAVTTGVLQATGDYVLFMDMDLATSLDHVPEFVAALDAGKADIVIASRERRGARREGTPWTRRVMGKGFNMLVRTLLLPRLSDTQCGFKAFRREVAHDLFKSMVVFADDRPIKGPMSSAFDVELLVMARRRGYRIKELPVHWRHVASRNVSVIRDPQKMFKQVIQVWLNDRRGLYRDKQAGTGA